VAASLEGRAAQATLMTVQNGLGAEDVVRRHGDWPLISAITFMSGTRHSDTEVDYIRDAATWLGPYEETPLARVREVEALIRSSGLRAQAFEDLRPLQWSKLVFNATVNGVAALTGLPHDFHFASEAEPTDLGRLVHALMEEGTAVAQAAGPGTADDPWEMNVHATGRGSGHYPSMLEDVNAERPTEVESINANGLRLIGAGDVLGLVRATTDAGELPACDLGIVATKAMHTEPAIAVTAHAFAEGAVASVQNGIGNEETLARHVRRVIRG